MRKIRGDEKEKLLKYVGKEPELNLFVIGDIENFGLESPEVGVFAKEGTLADADSEWDSIVLRYFDDYIIYSQKERYDSEAVAEFLRERSIDCISGKTSVIRQLEGFFPDKRLKPTAMLRCDKIEKKREYQAAGEIRRITPEDVDKVVELYLQIEEFSHTYQGKEEKQKEAMRVNLEKGGMGMGIFEGGKQFLCLFYDNPEAGGIYKMAGFKEIGEYALLR